MPKLIRLFVELRNDPECNVIKRRLLRWNIPTQQVRIEREYVLETEDAKVEPSDLFILFQDAGRNVSATSCLDEKEGAIIRVAYLNAVTDEETPSILFAGQAVGIPLLWAKTVRAYQLIDLAEDKRRSAEKLLANPAIETVIGQNEALEVIRPKARKQTTPEYFDLIIATAEDLEKISAERSLYLQKHQIDALLTHSKEIGRSLSDAELELISALWSDHCNHTTWKALGLLKKLRLTTQTIKHPLVLSAFVDNAGVIEFYDGYAITVKGETHNAPTAISPRGGVMTGHGGVIRDAIAVGRGAYPIGGTIVMGIGNLEQKEAPAGTIHPAIILEESVRATADYLNPIGIPMLHARYFTHPGFSEKCMMLGHAVGIMPKEFVAKGIPQDGDRVLLIGGRTGRDGLHGATFSSEEMQSNTLEKERTAVQIGHPIGERQIIDAIPVLRDAGCIRALTDLGAGGIGVAAAEMGEGTGMEIDLALVPLTSEGLESWEILLSESQERMLLAVPDEKSARALAILKSFGVEGTLLGTFTDTKRYMVRRDQEIVVDLPFSFLAETPLPHFSPQPDTKKYLSTIRPAPQPKTPAEWAALVKGVLTNFNVTDQSLPAMQFDKTVGGKTVIAPLGGAHGLMPNDISVLAPLYGKPYGLVTALSSNPGLSELRPRAMALLVLLEACAKLAAHGVRLDEIALCNNWYTPRITDANEWQLREAVEEADAFSRETKIPVITGKDSSSGPKDLPITLVTLALGRHPYIEAIPTKHFKESGNVIGLWGDVSPEALGGSIYLQELQKLYPRASAPLPILGLWHALERIQTLKTLYSYAAAPKLFGIRAVSAISSGGMFRRIFEMCYGSGKGARLDLTQTTGRKDGWLFSEPLGSIVLELTPNSPLLKEEKHLTIIGAVTDSPNIQINLGNCTIELPINELVEAWQKPFLEVLA